MYFLITSDVTLSPTVLAKYPSFHNSPAHNCFLSCGNLLNISRADILFNICTTSEGEYLGGTPKNICIWSIATSISSISNSYCLATSLNISLATSSISFVNIFLRYLGHHTKWYFKSYTACFVLLIGLMQYAYHTMFNIFKTFRLTAKAVFIPPARWRGFKRPLF